jgi:hypothetical protein
MKLMFVIIFISFLSGCSNEHSIDTTNIGEVTILVEQELLTFQSGSPVHLKVKEWLNQNRDGWESYYATAAIGKYVIKSSVFTLNIGKEYAILNYEHSSGNYKQISKLITAQEFDFIVE